MVAFQIRAGKPTVDAGEVAQDAAASLILTVGFRRSACLAALCHQPIRAIARLS